MDRSGGMEPSNRPHGPRSVRHRGEVPFGADGSTRPSKKTESGSHSEAADRPLRRFPPEILVHLVNPVDPAAVLRLLGQRLEAQAYAQR